MHHCKFCLSAKSFPNQLARSVLTRVIPLSCSPSWTVCRLWKTSQTSLKGYEGCDDRSPPAQQAIEHRRRRGVGEWQIDCCPVKQPADATGAQHQVSQLAQQHLVAC